MASNAASDEKKDKKEDSIVVPFQSKECVLYGSIFSNHLSDFENRLAGLCDPGFTEFHEHEMIFSLKTSSEPDVTLRLRRRFNIDQMTTHQWRFRYVGRPEPDPNSPVVVRKVIDSIAYSHNMMDFVKTLGLRMDYEYITRGRVYTAGAIKILVSTIQKSDRPGQYEASMLKKISDSSIVEISMCIPDSTEYMSHARMLRTFCDQFSPLVNMQKVDYWSK